MSADFEIAVEEGAMCVRVGQAIFGTRALPDIRKATAPEDPLVNGLIAKRLQIFQIPRWHAVPCGSGTFPLSYGSGVSTTTGIGREVLSW
jgi:hypothetical protein